MSEHAIRTQMRCIGSTLLIFSSCIVLALLASCKASTFENESVTSGSGAAGDSGEISIHKMGGGIDVKDAPHGASLDTMGGDIHVGNVAAFVNAKTMGGSIAIDHATGAVDVKTMGGAIDISHADGSIKATTMGGDVTVRMVGTSASQRNVDLNSNHGTITLTVPKDFPMDVQITLAYTKNSGKSYEIVQHAGLEERESPDWDDSLGSPRKYIRAAGHVGSGLNHVTIKTINGDVILKQE
jgi:DUF4097 and DUF4098 domain-containing protein YvlB